MKRHLRLLLLFIAAPLLANEPAELIAGLEGATNPQTRVFQLRDNKGHGLDCLEVFQACHPKKPGYYGISHSLKNGVLSLHLTHSTDLHTWVHLAELDQNGSQGTMHQTADGAFLLAYEKDAPNSCWLRLRSYPDLAALSEGKFDSEYDIPRSLAPTAEGTPSFEKVEIKNGDLSQSQITLRFHYYQDAHVDQLARGTLTNFKGWKATPSAKLNQAFQKLGGKGNLGDRSKFSWQGQNYYLQEVQSTRLDWGSWGIFLCDQDGLPLQKIEIQTPGKSTPFSNPSVTKVLSPDGKPLLILSAFLHRKGSAPQEVGQILMAFPSK